MLFRNLPPRTQTINALRGHLAEGVVAPQGRARMGNCLGAEDGDVGLPEAVVVGWRCSGGSTSSMRRSDRKLRASAREREETARLMTPGIGPITDGTGPSHRRWRARRGRDFSAWLASCRGSTPAGGWAGYPSAISATLDHRSHGRPKRDPAWRDHAVAGQDLARKPKMLVAVALANRARMVWALSHRVPSRLTGPLLGDVGSRTQEPNGRKTSAQDDPKGH